MADQEDRRSPEAKHGASTTLLGEAIAGHLAGQKAWAGRQIALFDEGDRLPDDDQAAELGDGKRGPGRPPGAGNKATEAFRRFVRSKYGDPLLKLMDRAFADPKTLAATLGAPSAWDVAKAQSEWLLRLLPYMHSAMPAEVKVTAKGAFAVALMGQPGGPVGDRVISADAFQALVEFQGLSEQPAMRSDAERSDVPPPSSVAPKA